MVESFLGSAASLTTRAGAPSGPAKLHVAGSCAYAGSTKANAMMTQSQARVRRKLHSSAEEGKADSVAAAGVVLVNKIIFLISTTPSARAKVASQLFFAAQPPLLV